MKLDNHTVQCKNCEDKFDEGYVVYGKTYHDTCIDNYYSKDLLEHLEMCDDENVYFADLDDAKGLRNCDNCKDVFNAGYYYFGNYYCTDNCLETKVTRIQFDLDHDSFEDDAYWTCFA